MVSRKGETPCTGYNLLILPRFEIVFGSGRISKDMTRANLAEIGDLRNIVFHFRRELNKEELEQLGNHRLWMLNTAKEFEGKRNR